MNCNTKYISKFTNLSTLTGLLNLNKRWTLLLTLEQKWRSIFYSHKFNYSSGRRGRREGKNKGSGGEPTGPEAEPNTQQATDTCGPEKSEPVNEPLEKMWDCFEGFPRPHQRGHSRYQQVCVAASLTSSGSNWRSTDLREMWPRSERIDITGQRAVDLMHRWFKGFSPF